MYIWGKKREHLNHSALPRQSKLCIACSDFFRVIRHGNKQIQKNARKTLTTARVFAIMS